LNIQDEEDLSVTLLKLIDDPSIKDPIAELRKIRLARKADYDRLAYDMAMNSPYKFERIVQVSTVDPNGNINGKQDKAVERLTVYYKDLPRFSKQAGVKTEIVQAVAEARQKEFKDRDGNIWRGYPFRWVDTRRSQEDIEEHMSELKEIEDLRRKNAERESNKQAVRRSNETVPIISIYG